MLESGPLYFCTTQYLALPPKTKTNVVTYFVTLVTLFSVGPPMASLTFDKRLHSYAQNLNILFKSGRRQTFK